MVISTHLFHGTNLLSHPTEALPFLDKVDECLKGTKYIASMPCDNASGDSGMDVPLQSSPRIPREHNKYHGYTVRGTPHCPLNAVGLEFEPSENCDSPWKSSVKMSVLKSQGPWLFWDEDLPSYVLGSFHKP